MNRELCMDFRFLHLTLLGVNIQTYIVQLRGLKMFCLAILGREIILVRGLVEFIPAVAYHFCLNLSQLACNILRTTYKDFLQLCKLT